MRQDQTSNMDKASAPPSDVELVGRARRGDHGAFHQLVDRHAHGLYRLAARLVGDADDAEDVLQESFAGAFRGLGGFREQSSVKTWLARIVIRQAADLHRRAARRRMEALPESGPTDAGDAARRSDMRLDVSRAIWSLSAEHREVVVLRELEGLSYDEIALALGVPRGTVESRLFRARRVLQEALREHLT